MHYGSTDDSRKVTINHIQRALTHKASTFKEKPHIKKRGSYIRSRHRYTEASPLLEDNRNKCYRIICLNYGLWLSVLVVALCSTGEQVLRKIVATNMYNYRWFMVEFMSILSVVICAFLCAFSYKEISRSFRWKDVPWRGYLICALLDAIHSISLFLAVGILPGSLSVLLPQAIVPLTVFFRFCTGDITTRKVCFVAGCLSVSGGVLLACIPDLLYFQPCIAQGRSHLEMILNILYVLIGLIPAAIGILYKQTILSSQEIHLYVFNFFLSLFTSFFIFFLSPVALILQYLGSSSPPARPSFINFASLSTALWRWYQEPSSILSSHPLSLPQTPIPLPFTSSVPISGNSFINFGRGLHCFLKINSQVGDICQELGDFLVMEVLGYILCTSGMSAALYKLMYQAKDAVAHYTFVFSTFLSCMFFQIPLMHTLMPTTCGIEFCFSIHVLAGAGLTLLGLIFCQVQEDEKPDEINIWDALLPPLPSNPPTNGTTNGIPPFGDPSTNPFLREELSETTEETVMVGSEGDILLRTRQRSEENLGLLALAGSYGQDIEKRSSL